MAKNHNGPTVSQKRETDSAWEQHLAESGDAISTDVDIDTVWAQCNPNVGASLDESAQAVDELTDYHFMDTADLEQIVGLGEKGSAEYEAAQQVLLQRPREYKPGKSGGLRYGQLKT
jgi:hypothetical protein